MKNPVFYKSWVGWFLLALSVFYLLTARMSININDFPTGIVPITMALSCVLGAMSLTNNEPEAILQAVLSAQGVAIALTGLSLLFAGLSLFIVEPWETISSIMTLFWYLGGLSAALHAARWRPWV